MFPSCEGKRQSPIDITPDRTEFKKTRLSNNYGNQSDDVTFKLKNNGHSAQVDIRNVTGLYSYVFGKV